jgi:hypothetical protein
MIVLRIDNFSILSGLGQRRTHSKLESLSGGQPRELIRREFEANLGILDTLHFYNIDPG